MFNKLLQIAEKGKYKLTDNYIYHIRTTVSDKEIFIVTSQRVMYIIRGYWTGSYKVFVNHFNNANIFYTKTYYLN